MTEISLYYEKLIICEYTSPSPKLQKGQDLVNVDNCYVICQGETYKLEKINMRDNKMYIIHTKVNEDPNRNKYFIFEIEMVTNDGEGTVYNKEFDDFFTSVGKSDGPEVKRSLSLRDFIRSIIKDTNNIKLRRDAAKPVPDIWLVVGKKLKLTTILSTPKLVDENKLTKAKIDLSMEQPADNSSTNPNTLKILDNPTTSVLKNCHRVGNYGPKITEKDLTDISTETAKLREGLTIASLVLFFGTIIIVTVYHLKKKSPDTDFFGYRLPEIEGGGVGINKVAGGGAGINKVAGGGLSGGSCSIPDLGSFDFQLPTPNYFGYAKFSTFLLVINMMIFGANPVHPEKLKHRPEPQHIEQHKKDREAFLAVGITFLVILLIVVFAMKGSNSKILSGIDAMSLLTYRPKCISVYFAVLAYLIFYTNFIKLIDNDVELPEFMLFMFTFIWVSVSAWYFSSSNTSSFSGKPVFAFVILFIIVVSTGGVMIRNLVMKPNK